jgi:hypothetical protein
MISKLRVNPGKKNYTEEQPIQRWTMGKGEGDKNAVTAPGNSLDVNEGPSNNTVLLKGQGSCLYI